MLENGFVYLFGTSIQIKYFRQMVKFRLESPRKTVPTCSCRFTSGTWIRIELLASLQSDGLEL